MIDKILSSIYQTSALHKTSYFRTMPITHLIVIKTAQLAMQAEFYTRLGFEFHYHQHGTGPFHYASTGEGVVLEIYPLPRGVTVADNTTRLGFKVDDIDTLMKTLPAEYIITAATQTEWGYTALVKDLDGRKIELLQK
ncbi:VOC family protein [Chitinophaga sp. RAB17]|uniref:VOC family protein n=1 Tax=Chitinophaga sp. RAB17 TaxID=3233049 RepID=UPI003F92CFC0